MLPDNISDIIDTLIRMWSASDIGLGECTRKPEPFPARAAWCMISSRQGRGRNESR
jgi:hypothetical protein